MMKVTLRHVLNIPFLLSLLPPTDLYCAKLAKLYPEDALDAAKADMVVAQAHDCLEVGGCKRYTVAHTKL